MATATAPINYQSSLQTLLDLLGSKRSETDQTVNQQTRQILEQLLTSAQTGSTSTTGTQTGTSTTTNTANLDALNRAFETSAAGMSPDQMQALITSIFTEGSQQVPSIIGAYANATGSRARGNSASRLALDELNRNLSTQAAQSVLNYNTAAQQTATNAAAQIAANTRETTNQNTQQNTQQQQTQQNTTQNTNQTQTGSNNTTTNTTTNNTIAPNKQNLGIAGGLSLLAQLGKTDAVKKLLGMVGGTDAAGTTMSAGGSPFSSSGSIATPSFGAAPAPMAANPLYAGVQNTGTSSYLGNTGLGAAPTQQDLFTNYLNQGAAAQGINLGGLGAGGAGVAGAPSLGTAGGGSSGLGSFGGSPINTIGNGGITDVMAGLGTGGGSMGSLYGGLGGGAALSNPLFDNLGASSVPDAFNVLPNIGIGNSLGSAADFGVGNIAAGNGGIYDIVNGTGGGFTDFLGGIGNTIGGIGSSIGDFFGSFFADGGRVAGMPGRLGYADGGGAGIGAPGDYRYGGGNIFQESLQRRMQQAGLQPGGSQVLQAGNVPRVNQATAPLPAPTLQQVMQLLPFLMGQAIQPGQQFQVPGMTGGFADGGTVRNQNQMGLPPVLGQQGAQNFTGYDNPQLAAFVNAGGSAADYIDPAARQAELDARAQMELQAQMAAQAALEQAAAQQAAQQQAAQGGATPQGGGAISIPGGMAGMAMGTLSGGGASAPAPAQQQTGDPRQAQINTFLAGVAGSNPIPQGGDILQRNLALNRQAGAIRAQGFASPDPQVQQYYFHLADQIQAQVVNPFGGGGGLENVGGVSAPGPSTSSVDSGIGAVGIGGQAMGIGNAAIGAVSGLGSPAVGIGMGGINAAANAVGSANAAANAAGLDAAIAAAQDGAVGQAVADAGAAATGAAGGAGSSGAAAGVASADGSPGGGGAEGSGGGGGGGGGKIICTAMNEMYGLEPRANRIWTRYSQTHLTPEHQLGYHKLFLPLVDYGFKRGNGRLNMVVRRALEWIATNRTSEIQLELAGQPRKLWRRALRATGEGLCYIVGKAIK